jgi:endonuclease/exonuclease/phosphatase family metal-dependent hydrolase
VVGLLLVLVGCTDQADTSSARHRGAGGGLTVMTQNLYLGAKLPVTPPATVDELLATTEEAYASMLRTDFRSRAAALADTIAVERPDLVGLQEVTRWTAQGLAPGSSPVSSDFLVVLREELSSRDQDYSVAAVSDNVRIGPLPLVAPDSGCGAPAEVATVPDCVLTIEDRDVVLVREDGPGLQVVRARTGHYTTQQEFDSPIGGAVSPDRGWAFVDVRYRGHPLRFLTTHLEVKDFADTQQAQGRELLAGPAGGRWPVVLAGDLNSAADPSTTRAPTTTYADLTSSAFRDTWTVNGDDPGATCCQTSGLDVPRSQLTSRVDVVLVDDELAPVAAYRVGDVPIDGATAPPFWASDHAGVVAVLRLG